MTRLIDRPSWPVLLTLALVVLLWVGCSDGTAPSAGESVEAAASVAPTNQPEDDAPALVLPPAGRPELLSEWGQLEVRGGQLVVADHAVPYTLSSALFSDHALKLRTVWVPDGEPARYDDEATFDFPVGTIITKTFYYPVAEGAPSDRLRVRKVASSDSEVATRLALDEVVLLETRVLVHRSDGWDALPYVWNADQTEATLQRTGELFDVSLVDGDSEVPFPYVVPNANQCAGCHATNHTTGAVIPIGPKARHLNFDVDYGEGPVAQLDAWRDRGVLADAPDADSAPRAAAWDDETADLDARARAYLDINCAHCHNEVGPADTSGLFLEASTSEGARLGVCKPPIAAGTGTGGRFVGIAPGDPDESIFVYRMETTDPGSMMPELGRALAHDEGVELISAWIASLTGTC